MNRASASPHTHHCTICAMEKQTSAFYEVLLTAFNKKSTVGVSQTRPMRKQILRRAELRSRKAERLNTASAVFDSPVIYGVRVETSNPYHLLISKCLYKRRGGASPLPFHGLRLAVKRKNVKSVFLLFSHFCAFIFVNLSQKSGCRRSWRRCGPESLFSCPQRAAYPRRPERPFPRRCPRPRGWPRPA